MKDFEKLGEVSERNKFDGSLIYQGGEFDEKTKRNSYIKHRENDSKLWFLEHDSDSIKQKYVKNRSCPICNEEKHDLKFIKDGFRHVECEQCKLVYVSPVLNENAQKRVYENEAAWAEVMNSEEEIRVNKIMYEYALKYLDAKFTTGEKKLLDIGSGSGAFLDVAKSRGWKVEGIEFNKGLVTSCKKRGLNVANSNLDEQIKKQLEYNLISMWHVFEHIENIHSTLEQIKILLAEKSLLFILVPQLDSLANRMKGKAAKTFCGYTHLNFFNVDTLSLVLEMHGFEVIAAETQITQLNTIKEYMSMGLTANSGINTLLNSLTPQYMHHNFLGSNLAMVARLRE
jgi:2-polyprenyl-3-methyl-5-hydroxy-6-metoxy-1,4-benzoquinol methylase